MERIQYEVVFVSSQAPDFPADNLARAAAKPEGWHSARHSTYPEQLILRLSQRTRVRQIQLLAHEFKVPHRLELYVAAVSADDKSYWQIQWTRLGGMTFDSNERSKFQARELKSVQVDVTAQLLKVVLHQPHANELNQEQQVALVALQVHGENSTEGKPNGLTVHHDTPCLVPSEMDFTTAREISQLVEKKAAAVLAENYDEAKGLKLEIERLRLLGKKILELEQRKARAVEEEDYDAAKAVKSEIAGIRSQWASAPRQASHDIISASGSRQSGFITEAPGVGGLRISENGSTHDHDERIAQAPRMQEDMGIRRSQPESAELETVSSQQARSSEVGQPPGHWPSDLPHPEPMSPADLKEADDVSELLGTYAAAALYSKVWQLREAGLVCLQNYLQNLGPDKSRILAAVPAATRAIQRAARERVPNVFQAGLQVLHQTIQATSDIGSRDAATLTSDLLPILLEKIGDSNARIQSAASDTIIYLADLKSSGLFSIAASLVAVQKQNAWKPVLARLQLLTKLLPILGVQSGSGDGIPLEGLMKLLGACFGSANADVRSAAVSLTVLVHNKVGAAAEKLLPRSLNPKIRQQIDEAIKPAEQGSEAPSSGQEAPAQSKVIAGDPNSAAESALECHAAPQEDPIKRSDSTSVKEDILPYTMELISREQLYGPHHPEVATCLSNLAILHNQQGDFIKAQPLYERALRIFELNFGPFDTNVAHTLTDLAVLHLELGNFEVGRPLLERALVIQERALGLDHPDVLAIRDVLDDGDGMIETEDGVPQMS